VNVDILKADAEAQMGLSVDDDSLGLEILAFRVDLEHSLDALFQGLGQLDEAAVKAQFGDAGLDSGLTRFEDDFGCGSERVPGSSASFVFQEAPRRAVAGFYL